jgi:hypothetical protein
VETLEPALLGQKVDGAAHSGRSGGLYTKMSHRVHRASVASNCATARFGEGGTTEDIWGGGRVGLDMGEGREGYAAAGSWVVTEVYACVAYQSVKGMRQKEAFHCEQHP